MLIKMHRVRNQNRIVTDPKLYIRAAMLDRGGKIRWKEFVNRYGG